MRILVCIKQKGEDGDIHRFDTHALEEALVLKDQPCNKIPDPVMVDVVTAGMLRAEKIIRRAFGMGADKGFHIITEDTYYTSSFMTASRLSVVAEKTPYDLILTGVMSEDMMAGQTGPMLARIMGLPCATGVVKVCLHPMDNKVTIEREMENGLRDSLVISLPAVLTIQAGINTPRYPSLSNMLKADKKKITALDADQLFSEPILEKETCIAMENPEKTRSGHILEGSISDKAEQVFSLLRQKNLI